MTRWREQGTAQSSAAGKGLRHRRAGRPLAWVTAMLAAGALAAGSSAAFAAPAAGSVAVTAAHGWTIAPSPNVTAPQGEFSGVWCAKAAACIAVGHRVAASGALVALAQLWNGKKWVTTGTAGLHLATFSAVSCTSASACTAVGNYTGETDAAFTLAEGWNGTTWSVQAPPAGSAEESSLAAVSCSAKAACTAVGQSPNGLPLAERWNGSQWTIQATAGSSALTGVSCATAHACTAIGGRWRSGGTARRGRSSTPGPPVAPGPSP
jgi:hypothetical protein